MWEELEVPARQQLGCSLLSPPGEQNHRVGRGQGLAWAPSALRITHLCMKPPEATATLQGPALGAPTPRLGRCQSKNGASQRGVKMLAFPHPRGLVCPCQ